MFEPPSQANDINQIQYVTSKTQVTMAWFPLQPSPKVLFWVSDGSGPLQPQRGTCGYRIQTTQWIWAVANMGAKFRLLMASDGFNPSQTWQGMIVLRGYTYLLVHLMCWMPRMPPELSPVLCKFMRQSSAVEKWFIKDTGHISHVRVQMCWSSLVHALLTHTSEGLVHNFDHGSLGSDLCCDQAHLHCWWLVSQWPN